MARAGHCSVLATNEVRVAPAHGRRTIAGYLRRELMRTGWNHMFRWVSSTFGAASCCPTIHRTASTLSNALVVVARLPSLSVTVVTTVMYWPFFETVRRLTAITCMPR